MSAHVPAVVVAGHVCIDEIITAGGTDRSAGSPAVFISPVLGDHGLPTTVIAPCARDFVELEHGLELLSPPRGDSTLVFVNDVRGARRTQAVRCAESAVLGHPDQAGRTALGEARALIFAPLLADPAVGIVEEYVAALPAGALRVILVQGYLRRLSARPDSRGNTPVAPRQLEEVDALLPLFDVAVLSDEDLSGEFEATVSAWSAAHPSSAIVVTRGAQGASAFTGGMRTDAPAHDVGALPAESLVGAGDIFSAELTAALLTAAVSGTASEGSAPAGAPGRERLLSAVAAANHATARRLAARRDLCVGVSAAAR